MVDTGWVEPGQNLNTKPILVFMAGGSGTGKTTVLEQLLPKLLAKGLKVGIIKHAQHIQLADSKDGTMFLATGAQPVTVVSSHNMMLMAAPKQEMSLEEVVSSYYQTELVDLIIVEGYKNTKLPKVEILRKAVSQKLYANPSELVCVVTDCPEAVPKPVPTVDFSEIEELAALVYAWYLGV